MKLGELFVQLTTKGDTKELEKSLKQLEKAHKLNETEIKTQKRLSEAKTQEQKDLIKKSSLQEKDIINTKDAIQTQNDHTRAIRTAITGFSAFVVGATVAYKAIDRMIMSLVSANQQMINFNRQTGISLNSLNRYASANVAVNANATIEGTAQSMQRVAGNLLDIRMGRGDVSPYQELAFAGGRPFNPANMSVEEVIENLRTSLKGVSDIQATNIITRMGFSPDDLQMLRMSRQEFEEIQGLFLDANSREQMNQYGLQLRKVGLQFDLLKDKALLGIMPTFIKFSNQVLNMVNIWADFIGKIGEFIQQSKALRIALVSIAVALGVIAVAMHPMVAGFLALYLVIEDIVGYFLGYKSVFGLFLDSIGKMGEKIEEAFANFTAPSFEKVTNWFKNLSDALMNIKMPEWIDKLYNIRFMGINAPTDVTPIPTNTNANISQQNTFHISSADNVVDKVAQGTSIGLNALIAEQGIVL